MSEVLRQHNIKLRNTTPYSPWVYGESEWFNRLPKWVNQCVRLENKDWRVKIDKFLLMYRASQHQITTVNRLRNYLTDSLDRKCIPQFNVSGK